MANDVSYTREIVVSVDAETAFKALTKEVGKWWAPKSDVVNEVGDVVKFQFPPTSWTMEVTQLIPDTFIELEVIEANHIDDRVPDSVRQEWLGTKLKWNIHPYEKGTKINFVHEGLKCTPMSRQ